MEVIARQLEPRHAAHPINPSRSGLSVEPGERAVSDGGWSVWTPPCTPPCRRAVEAHHMNRALGRHGQA